MAIAFKRILRVFVASPGDVKAERDALVKVIFELNMTLATLAPETGLALELLRWETHTAPEMGIDPQAVVNEYINDYDVFIGIMWSRFGTPTKRAGSGAHEEFLRAYERWQQTRELPLLFYFCQKPISIPRSVEEVRQLEKVVAFHQELSGKGLVWEYDDPETFADTVRPHLLLVLRRHVLRNNEPTAAEALPAVARSELEIARQDLFALANQYELVRGQMEWGKARTKKMRGIFNRMRALAAVAHPLIPSLVNSSSPGERLAAVSILLELPRLEYVDWLSERPATESAFLGYHATLALLQAVRELRGSADAALRSAVAKARQGAEQKQPSDPNQLRTLETAFEELQMRSPQP